MIIDKFIVNKKVLNIQVYLMKLIEKFLIKFNLYVWRKKFEKFKKCF